LSDVLLAAGSGLQSFARGNIIEMLLNYFLSIHIYFTDIYIVNMLLHFWQRPRVIAFPR
jgi:hypothetical protein